MTSERIDYRIDFATVPWQQAMPGLRFKAFDRSGRRLKVVEYSAEMEPHWCEKGHTGCILEGRFEIRFGERIEVYGPGDGIFIPAGPEHRHMGRALTQVVVAFFVEDI